MKSKVYVAPRRKSARRRRSAPMSPKGRARPPATSVAFHAPKGNIGLRPQGAGAVTRALLRLGAAIKVLAGYLVAAFKLARLIREIKSVAPPDNRIVTELLRQLGSLRLMRSVDDIDVAIGYVSAAPIIVGLFTQEEKTRIGKMVSELVGTLSWLQKNMLAARGADNQ